LNSSKVDPLGTNIEYANSKIILIMNKEINKIFDNPITHDIIYAHTNPSIRTRAVALFLLIRCGDK